MKILGIDGESISPHGYCLLASSFPEKFFRERRMETSECFDILLSWSQHCDRMFGYGIGYDVCHWIADLTDEEKTRLAKTGRCYTQQGVNFYRVRYIPSVLFQVDRLKGCPFNEDGKRTVASALVVDLMRWHRKPFVDVCREWGTSRLCDTMEAFKNYREGFNCTMTPEITRYCQEECSSIQRLAEQMLVRLKDIGIPTSHPFTSGSVAGQLAAKHRIHEYHREAPPQVSEAIQMAFYGGREQVTRYGLFRNAVQWDIRSAYGWAMMQLPDLLGEWTHDPDLRFIRPETEWGLLKVSWDLDEGRYPVMPFPHRDANGRVHYPPRGTGWYWSPVVRAARRHYLGDIRTLDAWHYIPKWHAKTYLYPRVRPFSYIGDLYDHRMELGSDPAEGLVKMLIVSTWGRMCSEGDRGSKTRGMLDWAGMTTALIHERMLDAINQTGQAHFISCCVDGFWTTSKISPVLPSGWSGNSIGEWDCKRADELFLIRPNCYWQRNGMEWTAHTSGFKWEGPAPDLRDEIGWRNAHLNIKQRRCRGLLSSSIEEDFSEMGQFYDQEIRVSLNPGFGRSGHECPTTKHGDTWRRWLPYWPPYPSVNDLSHPFVSRTGNIDTRWKEAAEGQAVEETMD